jgi:hypothetical protein
MIRASAAACLVLLMPSAALAARPAPPVVQHYESEDKLVFLPVRVNGSRPLTFILDSGAPHSIVDSTVAAELKVQRLSADRVSGAGKGTVPRQHAAPVDLLIGTVPLHVEDPWVIDLGKVGGIRHVDGLVGADLFERYVVGIDPVRQTLAIAEPATFRARGLGTSVPLILKDDRLYVDMTLTLSNGISEVHRVRIDTGSGDAVSDNLVRQSPERRKSVQGVGLGETVVDESGVFETVRIGPHVIRHSWGPSNDHPAVGMEIMRRFTMTFDVSHRRLYLLPNANLSDPVPAPPTTP